LDVLLCNLLEFTPAPAIRAELFVMSAWGQKRTSP
jgi:hypothetical protein